jgi:hypothetical protein
MRKQATPTFNQSACARVTAVLIVAHASSETSRGSGSYLFLHHSSISASGTQLPIHDVNVSVSHVGQSGP